MKSILLLLAGLAALPAIAEDLVRIGTEQAKAAGISTAALAGLRSTGERRLPAQAVVPPARTEIVAAPLGGLVTGVKAAYGEHVKRGQALARLQGPELLALQREFAGALAQSNVAVEARRRDESLFADGIISQSRLSATLAAERQASALVAEKRAALRLAGLGEPTDSALTGTTEIRAPYDAVVLEAPVQPGQRVETAAVLFKLGRLSPLWLEVQATPAQAAGLAPGDVVRVPGCATPGKLTLVAPHLDPATQSLLLRAEIRNDDGCVKPFQFVNVQIAPHSGGGAAWQVPVAALVRNQGQSWVFAEVPGGFRPVAVKVLDEAERGAAIAPAQGASAFGADMRIVVRGTAAVKAAWLGIGAAEPEGAK